jgi:hypothetical protein
MSEPPRLPRTLLLLVAVLAGCASDGAPQGSPTPPPSIVVGQPGGGVTTTESAVPAATPLPTLTPAATPTATPAPTPPPVAADGFSAEVLACQSISGSTCNGQLGTLPPGDGSFTALVRFVDANAGDTINAILNGPPGTVSGLPYTLQGGGDGYFYSTFTAGNLPPGTYTLTATRNGIEVATTSFERG